MGAAAARAASARLRAAHRPAKGGAQAGEGQCGAQASARLLWHGEGSHGAVQHGGVKAGYIYIQITKFT